MMLLKKLELAERRGSHMFGICGAAVALVTAHCAMDTGIGHDEPAVQAQGLTNQDRMNSFYEIGNQVSVKITMPTSEWDALRTEQPDGGVCNFDFTGDDRYSWHEATVEISGSITPAKKSFSRVGIKKKSFCGSVSSTKPSLKLDFGKNVSGNVATIEGLIGTQYLVLNNSMQDHSLVRQVLGSAIYKQAGLPFSRANFAKVTVNGSPVGGASDDVPGIFVSVEPPNRKRFVENNFGNANGNMYEFEVGDDFVSSRESFISTENLSKIQNKKDLQLANAQIATGLAGAAKVVDLDQFIKIYAMEFFMKHWDGYTNNRNNTFVYNDVNAVSDPSVANGNVKFKFIPWGLDQVLQTDKHFLVSNVGKLASMVRNDATRRAQLNSQIVKYRQTVFDRTTQEEVFIPLINQMESALIGMGVDDAATRTLSPRKQLKLAKSAGYMYGGLPSTSDVFVLDKASGKCMHASNTEGIPSGSTTTFEVVAEDPADSQSNHWFFRGDNIVSEAYGRNLHAGSSWFTSGGHRPIYSTSNLTSGGQQDFWLLGEGSQFDVTGYATILNQYTNNYLRFATTEDMTPSGRPRVYQESDPAKASLVSLY